MAIITIARGCFSHGREIAEKTARMLGYECVSHEILMEASRFFHLSEQKLLESIHDAPSTLEKITHGREKFMACIQAALLEHVKEDNVVYHGYAGHMLIPEILHVLKVRVIATMEDRIGFLQEKKGVSKDEAVSFIEKEDKDRNDWYHYMYKADMSDPHLYDIVLNIGRLKIPDACELICSAATRDTFRATPESEKAIRDLALSSHVKAALHDVCEAEVTANDGVIAIHVKGQKLKKTGFASPGLQDQVREKIRTDLNKKIQGVVRGIPGVRDVACDIDLPYYI